MKYAVSHTGIAGGFSLPSEGGAESLFFSFLLSNNFNFNLIKTILVLPISLPTLILFCQKNFFQVTCV